MIRNLRKINSMADGILDPRYTVNVSNKEIFMSEAGIINESEIVFHSELANPELSYIELCLKFENGMYRTYKNSFDSLRNVLLMEERFQGLGSIQIKIEKKSNNNVIINSDLEAIPLIPDEFTSNITLKSESIPSISDNKHTLTFVFENSHIKRIDLNTIIHISCYEHIYSAVSPSLSIVNTFNDKLNRKDSLNTAEISETADGGILLKFDPELAIVMR